jgi:hypothetical protein
MSEEEVTNQTGDQADEDSMVDAISAVSLVLIAVAFAVYWVSNQ